MPVDAGSFRDSLARFASGVTVVTVGADRPHGMTASSFASVSLDPPLVLVCLDRGSRTLALMKDQRRFAINVLASDQEELARTFATTDERDFDAHSHRVGDIGAPLLDGAIAWIECELDRIETAGDHDIVLGRVIATELGSGEPLLYFERSYRALR